MSKTCRRCGGARETSQISHCHHCVKTLTDLILPHNYRPGSMRFYGDPKDKLFIGVEIEAEFFAFKDSGAHQDRVDNSDAEYKSCCMAASFNMKDEMLKRVVNAFPLIYIKRDGTVGMGAEFVTMCMSYDWYVQNRGMFNQMFDIFDDNGIALSTRSGLHVHMSRDAFTPYQLFKFVYFYTTYADFVYRAGRRNAKHTSYCRKDVCRSIPRAVLGKEDTDRYTIVNLSNDATVEVRAFGGAAKASDLFSSVEFSVATFYFARDVSRSRCNPDGFVKYVQKNKKTYPFLHDVLQYVDAEVPCV